MCDLIVVFFLLLRIFISVPLALAVGVWRIYCNEDHWTASWSFLFPEMVEILAHVVFFFIFRDHYLLKNHFAGIPRRGNRTGPQFYPSVPFSDRLCNVINDFSVH